MRSATLSTEAFAKPTDHAAALGFAFDFWTKLADTRSWRLTHWRWPVRG